MNEINRKNLEDYEDYGMKIRSIDKYQEVFKSTMGRDLDPDKDMVLVGNYDKSLIYDNDNWTKVYLIGDDIGDGEFYFFLYKDEIYLDKGNLMLIDEHHEVFKKVIGQVFHGMTVDITY